MQQKWAMRLAGEFAVIVLGVLVALAVDDWRQYRANRELQEYLLDRLAEDLRADAADLLIAQIATSQRQWVLEALTTDLADGVSDGQPPVAPPDSLAEPVAVRARLGALGRTDNRLFRDWTPTLDALDAFRGIPAEFDRSDDAFQEMLVSGALQTLADRTLRSEIARYYRVAADFDDNARNAAQYQGRLENVLSTVGITVRDSLTMLEFGARVASHSGASVEFRRVMSDLINQQTYFRAIELARVRLEASLAERGYGTAS